MPPQAPMSFRSAELMALKSNWGLLLALGIGLIILGLLAMLMPFVAGVAVTIILGCMLLVGGVFQVVGAFFTRAWGAFFLNLLIGILYVIVGLLILEKPVGALEVLTILIAAALLVGGLFRIVSAVVGRFEGWGWLLFMGIVDVILGLLIWRQLPASALWVIGLFLGINMLFSGATWAALAMSIRDIPQPTEKTAKEPEPAGDGA